MSSLFTVIWLLFVAICRCQHDCLKNRSPEYQNKYIRPILDSLVEKGYEYKKGYLYWITNMKKHGGSPSSAYGMWNFNLSSEMKPNPDAPMSMLFHPSDAILFTGCSAPLATYIGFENYAYAKYNVPTPNNQTNQTNNRAFDHWNTQKSTKNTENILKNFENSFKKFGNSGQNVSVANNSNHSVGVNQALVFSSMNGAINQHFMNISWNDYYLNEDSPFDSIYTVITTGDKVTFNDIYRLYDYYNISETVNNIWIPQQYFKYTPYNFSLSGYNVGNYPGRIDTFMPVQRIINHFDQRQFEYYTNYHQPCYLITPRVARVPKNKRKSEDNYTSGYYSRIINDTNTTEPREAFTELFDRNSTSLMQESEFELYYYKYWQFINQTIEYFVNEYGYYNDDNSYRTKKDYTVEHVETRALVNYNLGKHDYGWICYENNMNCQGDLRDEQYWGTHNGSNVVRKNFRPWETSGTYYLTNDSFNLLIGMNHFNTNFTVFDNVIFYYDVNTYLGLFEPIYTITNFEYNNSCNIFVDSINKNEILDDDSNNNYYNNYYNSRYNNYYNNYHKKYNNKQSVRDSYFSNFTSDELNKFYMVQIARPVVCDSRDFSFEIPSMCPNHSIVDTRHHYAIYTRNLLNPYTLTRPNTDQIIGDTLIRFKVTKH